LNLSHRANSAILKGMPFSLLEDTVSDAAELLNVRESCEAKTECKRFVATALITRMFKDMVGGRGNFGSGCSLFQRVKRQERLVKWNT
jgi:hypothetical protein